MSMELIDRALPVEDAIAKGVGAVNEVGKLGKVRFDVVDHRKKSVLGFVRIEETLADLREQIIAPEITRSKSKLR